MIGGVNGTLSQCGEAAKPYTWYVTFLGFDCDRSDSQFGRVEKKCFVGREIVTVLCASHLIKLISFAPFMTPSLDDFAQGHFSDAWFKNGPNERQTTSSETTALLKALTGPAKYFQMSVLKILEDTCAELFVVGLVTSSIPSDEVFVLKGQKNHTMMTNEFSA